jgi:hypothetical protein
VYQGRHAFSKGDGGIVRQDFRVAPKGARPAFQAIKRKRGGSAPQVVASQERLPAGTKVLFYRTVVFPAARRAFQLNDIQGFGYHRKSLAQAFLALAESGSASSDFLNPLPKVTPQKSPEGYAIGVSDSCSDFFYTLVSRLQQMHRALHTQLLEIRQW